MTKPRRALTAATVAAALAAAVPAAASATTYCVHQPSDPCAPGTTDMGTDLQGAFDDAGQTSAADTIEIGPGTFTAAANSQGFRYPSGYPLTIVGAGRGQTTLTDQGNAVPLSVGLFQGPTSNRYISISHLTAAPVHTDLGGLQATYGTIDDVDVRGAADGPGGYGVSLNSADVQNATIDVTGATMGILSRNADSTGPNHISDVRLSGPAIGVRSQTPTQIHRSSIEAGTSLSAASAPVSVDDSLLLAQLNGITAQDGSDEGSVNALNVTVVAPGGSAGAGASATGTSAGQGADIDLTNSIVRGFTTSLTTSGSYGVVTASYVNYDGATTGAVTEASHVNGDPTFVNAAAGDYHLRFDSPLIDRSPTTDAGPDSSTTDLDGNPRVVNVNGGAAPVDIGAYEYQDRAPVAGASASPAHGAIGQAFAFDGSASSDPDPGDQLSYSWSFDDGARASGTVVHHAFATPGPHSGTLTVTDSTGLHATKSVAVVADAPAQNAPAGGPAAAPRVTITQTTMRGTEIDVTVHCVTGPCSGTIDETTVEHLAAHGRIARLSAARKKTKTVTVGSRSFTVASGRSALVKVPLNAAGRKLLAKFRKLPLTLVVKLGAATVKTSKLTVRQRAKHGHA